MSEPAAGLVLRVANCSGFFGDRLSAAREMVEGGPIDVLTGDWLAELTMYILHKTRERSGGYARTFLRQLEEVLPTCVERGITVVSNAGGLHPEALAAAVRELARRQGLDVRVASVSGDDITPRLAELRAAGRAVRRISTPASRFRRRPPSSRPTPTCAPARSRTRWPPARRWSSRAGSPTPPWSSGRRCTPSGGRTASTTPSPGRSWRATSSSAAPSAAAATTPSSTRCRAGSGSASRWPRCTPTARRSSPSTRGREAR